MNVSRPCSTVSWTKAECSFSFAVPFFSYQVAFFDYSYFTCDPKHGAPNAHSNVPRFEGNGLGGWGRAVAGFNQQIERCASTWVNTRTHASYCFNTRTPRLYDTFVTRINVSWPCNTVYWTKMECSFSFAVLVPEIRCGKTQAWSLKSGAHGTEFGCWKQVHMRSNLVLKIRCGP